MEPLQPDPELQSCPDPRTQGHTGQTGLGPSGVWSPPPLPPALSLHPIMSTPQGHTAQGRCGKFAFCDSTVDSEHSRQSRSSQSQAISLSVVPQALTVYSEFQAGEENLPPYLQGRLWRLGWGGVSCWLAFQGRLLASCR